MRRCRSAFKLLDINERTPIIGPGDVVVDCGAAPGSWTQVAVKHSNANGAIKNKPSGLVIGVDLHHIYPIEVIWLFGTRRDETRHLCDIHSLFNIPQGAQVFGNTDFTLPESQEKIKTLLKGRLINCVISDMAPNATGVRCLDQENIIKLCYSVLRFAIPLSAPDANCLMKVWDNGDVAKLEADILKFYKHVKRVKPPASRSDSAEIFILAKEFAGPSNDKNTWNMYNILIL